MPSGSTPLLLRLYRLSARLVRVLEEMVVLLRAAHVGFWLGVLDRRRLHQVDHDYYLRAPRYTDAGYNTSGLHLWEAAVMDEFFAEARTVVVLAAGGGREVVALAERGLEVRGFECNPELVATANRLLESRGLDARLEIQERDCCPALDGTWDGAVVGWAAYMLIQGRGLRVEMLRALSQHLQIGSPVLLSFFFRRGRELRLRVAMWVANVIRHVLRRQRVELGDYLSPTYLHFFDEDELRSELEEAGYELVRFNTSGYGHAVAAWKGPQPDRS